MSFIVNIGSTIDIFIEELLVQLILYLGQSIDNYQSEVIINIEFAINIFIANNYK